MEDRKNITFRVPDRWHRLYKALCAEEGITIQDDLERYVHRRLREAGRLPEEERRG